MILKRILLKNIRSYRDKTIEFNDGTTLISGDIGSGKSTILLSIEFGLFGLTQGISYSDILRRGSNEGEIRLLINIDGNDIEIERKLKRSTNDDSIKQLPGTITVNKTSQILTPSEMKSRIDEIIAYPQSHKNLLYRFSVYTPQESMKLILFEDEEDRLNVIRKIFGLDKYKTVKDNITIVSRSIRNKIKINEELSKGIDEDKKKIEEERTKLSSYLEKKKRSDISLSKLNEGRLSVLEKIHENDVRKKTISDKKEKYIAELERIRQAKKDIDDLRRSIISFQNDLNNIEKIKDNFIEQARLLGKPSESSIDALKKRSEDITKEINSNESLLKSVTDKISLLERQMQSVNEDISRMSPDIDSKAIEISSKQNIIDRISSENIIRTDLDRASGELEDIRSSKSNLNAKKDMLCESAKNISGLETCPTCRQVVTLDHKHSVEKETKEKLDYIEKALDDRNQKEKELSVKCKELESKIKEIVSLKEQLRYVEKIEKDLETSRKSLDSKRTSLKSIIAELEDNRKILADLGKFNRKDKESEKHSIDESIRNIQKKNELDIKITSALERIAEKKIEIAIARDKCSDKESAISSEPEIIREFENITLDENQTNDNLSGLKTEESMISQEMTRTSTEISALSKDIEYTEKSIREMNSRISEKESIQKETQKARKDNEFLTSRLVPVIDHIEKTMLREINERLNSHFSRWFDILMEDEEISARINDKFTPIVTVEGHDADINSLSGGEKTSLALAYRLSINKVINDLVSGIKTKDLIILDEPTDGFSSEQLDKMKDVLDNLNLKQVIIVSHETKIESYVQNIIRLQKTNHMTDVM